MSTSKLSLRIFEKKKPANKHKKEEERSHISVPTLLSTFPNFRINNSNLPSLNFHAYPRTTSVYLSAATDVSEVEKDTGDSSNIYMTTTRPTFLKLKNMSFSIHKIFHINVEQKDMGHGCLPLQSNAAHVRTKRSKRDNYLCWRLGKQVCAFLPITSAGKQRMYEKQPLKWGLFFCSNYAPNLLCFIRFYTKLFEQHLSSFPSSVGTMTISENTSRIEFFCVPVV